MLPSSPSRGVTSCCSWRQPPPMAPSLVTELRPGGEGRGEGSWLEGMRGDQLMQEAAVENRDASGSSVYLMPSQRTQHF